METTRIKTISCTWTGGIADDAICHNHWRQIASQSAGSYATPSGTVGRRFKAILAAEWWGVLVRTYNSVKPLVFAHIFLMETLSVVLYREIRAHITRQMDLWERGIHSDLVGDVEAEGDAKEGRAASGGEEEDQMVSRSCHDTILSGKLKQAVCWETNREGGGFLLPDDQCTKTRKPVAEDLQEKHPDTKFPPMENPMCASFEEYREVPKMVPLDFTEDDAT